MARPITLELPPRDPQAELQSRLQGAPAEHAEALLAALEVLQGLHDRGVLELIRGALGSSDKVLEIAVDVAKSPDSTRSMRNLLLVVNALGAIDPEEFKAFTQSVPPALKLMAQQTEPPGLWKFMRNFLWNRDIRRGLSALTIMLETFGATLARDRGHG